MPGALAAGRIRDGRARFIIAWPTGAAVSMMLPQKCFGVQGIGALVGGDRPRKHWSDLKKKLDAEGYFEVSEKIGQLKMLAAHGKQRLTDCANTETLRTGRWRGGG